MARLTGEFRAGASRRSFFRDVVRALAWSARLPWRRPAGRSPDVRHGEGTGGGRYRSAATGRGDDMTDQAGNRYVAVPLHARSRGAGRGGGHPLAHHLPSSRSRTTCRTRWGATSGSAGGSSTRSIRSTRRTGPSSISGSPRRTARGGWSSTGTSRSSRPWIGRWRSRRCSTTSTIGGAGGGACSRSFCGTATSRSGAAGSPRCRPIRRCCVSRPPWRWTRTTCRSPGPCAPK